MIGVTLAVSLAAVLTGVLLMTRDVSMADRDQKGLAAAQNAEESKLMKAVTGDRSFAAKPKTDGTEAPGDKETEATQPTYTAGTMPSVTGLSRLSEEADSLRIGWDEIPGADGYRVYHRDDNDPKADFTLFSTVKRAGLDIRNLDKGSKYTFRVIPFIAGEGVAVEGEAAEATFATTPTGVKGFRLKEEQKDATTISWKQNDRADGYLLERCYKGEWSDCATLDADATEFTDDEVKPGNAYYYRISAFREDSDGKLMSDATIIRTYAGLIGPKDKKSASKLGRVSLDYEKSEYADGYRIYYSTDDKNWEKLTETEKTHYSTSRLEDGKTYYFRIYPYKEVGENILTGGYTEMEFVANTEIYGKTVGDTYVEVNLNEQHMWYIVDGDVYLESDCVTGNYGSADTPKGYFEVNNKLSPCTLKGDDYTSYVTYWMPFIGGGWGLHDASWRSSFGGNIYKGNGSHGCVNLPADIAKKMYAHIEVGTPVIVY